MIAQTLNLQIVTKHYIMSNDVNMQRVCGKLVPKIVIAMRVFLLEGKGVVHKDFVS